MSPLSVALFAILCALGAAHPLNGGRIVGGKDTNITEVPWTVSLEFKNKHFCGGTIISDKFILTAGHCIDGENERFITIRTGSSTLVKGGVIYKVKKLIPIPQYDMDTIDYDVGLIELTEPIKFDNKTKAVKLASKEPKGGEMVTVSGWGYIKEEGPKATVLQSVALPAKSRKECEKAFEGEKYTSRMICMGCPGKDACTGDSGGPAVYKGTIVGVVSWGIGCGCEVYPGVYANVADPEIRKFIKDKTGL